MDQTEYLKILVEDIHSTTVATIGANGHPQTRVIDMMLWDEKGVYFLTAKGKEFYAQLMEQNYISLSAVKEKRSISLRGKIRNIHSEKLDEIFEKNTYMQGIYPGDTRSALEVFQLYEAEGEYFDISEPSHIVRGSFTIGKTAPHLSSVISSMRAASAVSSVFPSVPRNVLILRNYSEALSREVFWHEYAKIPRVACKNPIAKGDFYWIFARNCEGTEQLRYFKNSGRYRPEPLPALRPLRGNLPKTGHQKEVFP